MRRTVAAPAGAVARGPDDWVERVRAASDIVEIVGQSVALKRVGRNWVGLCPFHQEKTPSFSVNPERQFYHCFSCKAGGDVFRFVQETEKIGFLDAVELLSRRAGIEIPERRAEERGSRRPLLDALEAAAASYEQWLGDPEVGRAARAYLERRGLSPETIREYRLGLARPGWEHLVGRLGERFGVEVLVQAGLAAHRDTGRGAYDRFRDRLMVPLIAPGGIVVGFGARTLDPAQEPKYLNSPETAVYRKSAFLFGFEQARRAAGPSDELVVVEGYFDAMALHQAGIRGVVATSGTALTAEHARTLRRAVARVALTFDGDAAGQDAMLRSLGTLLAAALEVVVVELPRGEDPDSLVRKGGADAWSEVRRTAMDPVAYIQRHGLRAAAAGDPRERALQVVVSLAQSIEDPIRLRLFLERATEVFAIPERVLARAVSLRRSGQASASPVTAAVREQARGHSELERQVLQALLHAPEHLEAVREHLTPDDFLDPACAGLAKSVWTDAPSEAMGPDAAALRRELFAAAVEDTDWVAVIEGGVRRLVRRRLERQRRELRIRLGQAQGGDGAGLAESLLEEYQRLTELIRGMENREHDQHVGETNG